MKTFEEFSIGKNRTIFNKPHGQFQDGHVEVALTEVLYKQIQLDAMKEGARRAAKLVDKLQPSPTSFENNVRMMACYTLEKRILTTAERPGSATGRTTKTMNTANNSTAERTPGSLHPAGSASPDKQATEHCVLCNGDGWRWILTRGMKFTKVTCCDCNGEGRRPVRPNNGRRKIWTRQERHKQLKKNLSISLRPSETRSVAGKRQESVRSLLQKQ